MFSYLMFSEEVNICFCNGNIEEIGNEDSYFLKELFDYYYFDLWYYLYYYFY